MLRGFIFLVGVPRTWGAWCEGPFLSPVCTCMSLLPKDSPAVCPSCPLRCGVFSPFLWRVCSARLQVVPWVIYTDVDVIWLYPWDEVSLGSSYSTVCVRSLLYSRFCAVFLLTDLLLFLSPLCNVISFIFPFGRWENILMVFSILKFHSDVLWRCGLFISDITFFISKSSLAF